MGSVRIKTIAIAFGLVCIGLRHPLPAWAAVGPGTGACCYLQFGWKYCVNVTEFVCGSQYFGSYKGDNTACINTYFCPEMIDEDHDNVADVDVDPCLSDSCNLCALDTDGDGITNDGDADVDGDGIWNYEDPDMDNDGIPNGQDSCTKGAFKPAGWNLSYFGQSDTDADGIKTNGGRCVIGCAVHRIQWSYHLDSMGKKVFQTWCGCEQGGGTDWPCYMRAPGGLPNHLASNHGTKATAALEVDCNPDLDSDGIHDDADNCPALANADQSDTDGDGKGNVCDNCPAKANSIQDDQDHDGIGDDCDPDYNPNGNGAGDPSVDCCITVNADGFPDDADWDNDGIENWDDDCPTCRSGCEEVVYQGHQSIRFVPNRSVTQSGSCVCSGCPHNAHGMYNLEWCQYDDDWDDDGVPASADQDCAETQSGTCKSVTNVYASMMALVIDKFGTAAVFDAIAVAKGTSTPEIEIEFNSEKHTYKLDDTLLTDNQISSTVFEFRSGIKTLISVFVVLGFLILFIKAIKA